MEVYTIGQRFEKWKTGINLVQSEYDGSTLTIICGFPKPTQAEISDIIFGNFLISFAVIDNMVFLLAKYGGQLWMDTPFNPQPYTDEYFNQVFDTGKGLPVCTFLVDTKTGKLMRMRLCGFSTRFSNSFIGECRRVRSLPPMDPTTYDRKLRKVYSRYPTSESMLAASRPEWASGILVEEF